MDRYHNEWSRRNFIGTVAGMGATIMLKPLSSWAAREVDPRIAAIAARTIAVDTHNHIDVPLTQLNYRARRWI